MRRGAIIVATILIGGAAAVAYSLHNAARQIANGCDGFGLEDFIPGFTDRQPSGSFEPTATAALKPILRESVNASRGLAHGVSGAKVGNVAPFDIEQDGFVTIYHTGGLPHDWQ